MKSGFRSGCASQYSSLRLQGLQLADHAVRTQHADRFVKVRVVGADHAAFDRAQMVGVVEGEVGSQTEGAELSTLEGGAVRLAHVLDQRNPAALQFVEQFLGQGVVAEDVSQKDGPRPRRDPEQAPGPVSMPSVRGSMSTKTGSKPQCSTAAMSETQVSGGTMISPPPCSSFSAASVSRLADEPELTKDAVLHAEPVRPFVLEGADAAWTA